MKKYLKNKMRFLPSCGNTTVWMHQLDPNKMHG